SDISLSITIPRPCHGEPSRRIAGLLWPGILEVAGIDHFQAWLIKRQLFEATARRYRRGSCFRAQIAIANDTETTDRGRFDAAYTRQRGQTLGQTIAAFGFELNGKAAAEHMAPELPDGAH